MAKKTTTQKTTTTKPAPQAEPLKAAEKQPSKLGFTLLGVGLVGLVGASALVGLGVWELPVKDTDIKILGQDAYQNQPRTPLVSRSEPVGTPETETTITLLEDGQPQTTVAANPDGTVAVTTETAGIAQLNQKAADLKTIVEAQQQMLRMLSQQQEELAGRTQAQVQKLTELMLQMREEFKPVSMERVEMHLARLYLMQGVNRLYIQWQNGILLPETVLAWAKQADVDGFTEASSLGAALTTILKEDGLLNTQGLIASAMALQAQQQAAVSEEAANQGFWDYLKAKLKALITIEKADNKTLPKELISILQTGDVTTFWQQLQANKDVADPVLVQKMRKLVESHTSQKFAFDNLYQALAVEPMIMNKPTKPVAKVIAKPAAKPTAEAAK